MRWQQLRTIRLRFDRCWTATRPRYTTIRRPRLRP